MRGVAYYFDELLLTHDCTIDSSVGSVVVHSFAVKGNSVFAINFDKKDEMPCVFVRLFSVSQLHFTSKK